MLTREGAIKFLRYHPLKFAHLLGFDKLTELHEGWIMDMAFGQEDRTLEAHRNSYKTTCVSIALSEIILLLPKLKTVFMRKTDTDVKEVIRQVQKILLHPKTQYLSSCIYGQPVMLTTANATEITTNLVADVRGTSQLMGIGIGGSITGKHFDRIFTDDIINIQDRISKAERDRTKYVYQELQNVKNRGGRIFNTLTPWHKDDASIMMPEPMKWNCYETGLLSEEQIAELKKSMTSSLFAVNYELRHIASDDVIFSDPQTGGDPSFVEQGTGHIDAAYHGEDYTAYTLVRLVNGKYYVYGKLWRKHIDDVLDEICEIHHDFMGGKIYCEENGDKGYLAKDLRKRGERVVLYTEKMNKYLKITSYLKFEWQNVIFVKGTDTEYINQICDFNDDAEHDDAPDSLASMLRVIPNKVRGEGYLNVFGR